MSAPTLAALAARKRQRLVLARGAIPGSVTGNLVDLDLDSMKASFLSIPQKFAHGYAHNPRNPDELLIVDKA